MSCTGEVASQIALPRNAGLNSSRKLATSICEEDRRRDLEPALTHAEIIRRG